MGANAVKLLLDPELDHEKAITDESRYYKEVKKSKADFTPWERVTAIFETDEYGDLSPEYFRIYRATSAALVSGFIFGGIFGSQEANVRFQKNTAHLTFETAAHAKRAMYDKRILGFGSGAAKLGWRLGLFTFVYITSTTAIAAYRGGHGIVEHVGGASLAGFLYKFKSGPKPAIAGLVVGAGLGLTAGCIQWAGFKISGVPPDYLANWHEMNLEHQRLTAAQKQRSARMNRTGRLDQPEEEGLMKFHETWMATDELSASTAPDTDIGKMAFDIRNGAIPPPDLSKGIHPQAIIEAVKEVEAKKAAAEKEEEARKKNNTGSINDESEKNKSKNSKQSSPEEKIVNSEKVSNNNNPEKVFVAPPNKQSVENKT